MTKQTGEELKKEGIGQVTRHNLSWLESATTYVRMNMRGKAFTVEDVRDAVVPLLGEPIHPNTWGALMQHMARDFAIMAVGHYKAQRSISHSRHLNKWRVRL